MFGSCGWIAMMRHARCTLFVALLAAAAILCLLGPSAAEAGLYNPMPADAFGDPTYDFLHNQSLWAYATSDIKGGRICVVPAEGELSSLSCDSPADGMGNSTTIAASIGTVYTLVKNAPLRVGTYRLLVENSVHAPLETSQPFTVSPCIGCDRKPDQEVVDAFKAAAVENAARMAGMCAMQGLLKKLAGAATGMAGFSKSIKVPLLQYSADIGVFVATPGLGFTTLTFTDPLTVNINKGLDILKQVSCGAKQMYEDIAADPPDPAYATIAQPVFADIPRQSPAPLDAVARSIDNERGLTEAVLHAFERYQGANAASDASAQITQLRVAGDDASGLSKELSRSAEALRAWSDAAAADPDLAGTVLASTDKPGLVALYQRVRDSGFTAVETLELHALGYTDSDIAAIRTHASVDLDEVPVDTTYPDALRAIANALEGQAGAVADFASEMYGVAGGIEAATSTNRPPFAAADSISTTRDTPASVNVLANDSDPDGDSLDLSGSARGAHGTVSCETSGVCTYAPASGYLGSDSFTYTVSDGIGGIASGTVTVTVALPNRPPSAVDDNVVVDENAQTEVFALANDLDSDGEVLRLDDTTPPSHGSLTFGVNSRIFYTPNESYVGSDSFTYTISDGRGGTATATVHVTVEAVPEATNDDFQNATPISALPFTVREGATLATQAADDPAQSCGVPGATVWYAYTPSQDRALEVDTIGSSSPPPTVAVYTGTRGSLTEVACAQGKPLSLLASAGRTYYFMVDAYFVHALHFAVRVPTSLSLGTLAGRFFSTPLGSGAISAKPGDPVAFTKQFPVINFNPPEDSALNCSNETGIDVYSVPFTDVVPGPEGSCTTLPATGSGFQAGLDDLSSFNAVFTNTVHVAGAGDVAFSFYSDDGWIMGIGPGPGGAQPTYVAGSFVNPPQRSPFEGYEIVGSFNGPNSASATGVVVHFPAAGDYPAEIDYSECCGGALSLTLDTNGAPTPPSSTNRAPVASGGSLTTTEDTAKALTLQASDADGDTLAYTIVSGPSHGTLTGSGANRTYTPAAQYNGPDSFTFKVNDGQLDSNTATLSITVDALNHAPVAQDGSLTTDEDTAKTVALQASDLDGNSLAYSIVSAPTHGVLSGSGATRTYTPDANYSGSDSFTFKTNDGRLDSNVARVSITVTPVNDPPTLRLSATSTAAQYSDPITPVTVTVSDIDSSPSSLSVSVGVPGLPGNLAFSGPTLDPVAGTATFSLSGRLVVGAGSYPLTLRASDGSAQSSGQTLTVAVSRETATIAAFSPEAITVDGSDGDVDALTETMTVTEDPDGYPSSSLAPGTGLAGATPIALQLAPAFSGASYSCTATSTAYLFPGAANAIASCAMADVVVNVYLATATVGANPYFAGSGSAVVTVTNPALGFTTGGGHVTPGDGTRVNFGFNAKTVNGGQAKGSLLAIFHRRDGNWILKSNVLGALQQAKDPTGFWSATIGGKATLAAPLILGCGQPKCGNYSFSVYVEDRAEPGAGSDRFWIEVKDPSGQLVATVSLSSPASRNALTLAGGNIQVPHPQGAGSR
jgi:hypothetical protein